MINSISLRNFKCFEAQEFSIKNLTLLTGLNGMGKSSLLQALLLLRQSYLDGILPKTGLELNGSLVQLGTAHDVLYEDAQSDDFEIGIKWENDKSVRFILEYNRQADVLKIDPASVDTRVFSETPFTGSFHYLQAERLGPRTSNAVSDFQVRESRQLGTAGEFAGHFLHVYGEESVSDQLLHDTLGANSLTSQVQSWLREVSPGAELYLTMHQDIDLVSLRYAFVTGEQRSNPYRSTSVGFGISYVLPVLIAVLSAQPGGMLLIENPEAHLHPRGQSRIGELLARAAAAGIQVVVETHSDHVLNGMRLAVHSGILSPALFAIHYFSRAEKGERVYSKVDSPNIDRNGRIDKWPEGFFDEWDKSLERLLGPAKE